eukprot:SAG31_NODE_6671_length_1924_cov_2.909389_1_plen_62_part_00
MEEARQAILERAKTLKENAVTEAPVTGKAKVYAMFNDPGSGTAVRGSCPPPASLHCTATTR